HPHEQPAKGAGHQAKNGFVRFVDADSEILETVHSFQVQNAIEVDRGSGNRHVQDRYQGHDEREYPGEHQDIRVDRPPELGQDVEKASVAVADEPYDKGVVNIVIEIERIR